MGDRPVSANLWDPIPRFPLLFLPPVTRVSVIAAGGRKTAHDSSLGQDHTMTFVGKSYFFCMTNERGSRIFRWGYSFLKEKIKIVPAKELKKLQREEEPLNSVLSLTALSK